MFRTQAATPVDHLTGLRQELTDRTLVLNGVFDAQIKALEAVRSEAEEKLGMVDTVKAADQYRKDAEAYGTKLRDDADRAMAAASDALAKANAKMDAALTKEKSVASREDQTLALMADYQHKADSFDADCAKREASIATRTAALDARQAKLDADGATFAEQKAEAIRKLDAAKALATS